MAVNRNRVTRLESNLAHLLGYGTWLGTLLITLGLAWPVLGASFLPGHRGFVSLGVMILIALPVLRVLVMLWNFARSRESVFALLALAVLGVIVLGLFVGTAER